jgi:hypothetical protein
MLWQQHTDATHQCMKQKADGGRKNRKNTVHDMVHSVTYIRRWHGQARALPRYWAVVQSALRAWSQGEQGHQHKTLLGRLLAAQNGTKCWSSVKSYIRRISSVFGSVHVFNY